MDELFPIGAGLIFGIAFAANFRILRPWWIKAIFVVVAGASATILSGEHVENWGFILVDLGEVALAAWIAAYLCAGWRRVVCGPGRKAAKSRPATDGATKARVASRKSQLAALRAQRAVLTAGVAGHLRLLPAERRAGEMRSGCATVSGWATRPSRLPARRWVDLPIPLPPRTLVGAAFL